MKIVGLTGGIACGKSTVSAMLRDAHGLPVVDADEIAKAALDVGTPAYHKVVAAFGDGILELQTASSAGDADAVCLPRIGSRPIDRKKLGAIVFNDVVQRRKLNGIISPYIARSMAWQCLKHFAVGTPVLVLDVPLLYETVANHTALLLHGLVWLSRVAVTEIAETHLYALLQGVHRACSEVVVVSVSPAVQLERLTRRDDTTEREATSRINAQMPLADKVQRADIIIDNDGTEVDLIRKVAGYGMLCPRPPPVARHAGCAGCARCARCARCAVVVSRSGGPPADKFLPERVWQRRGCPLAQQSSNSYAVGLSCLWPCS